MMQKLVVEPDKFNSRRDAFWDESRVRLCYSHIQAAP